MTSEESKSWMEKGRGMVFPLSTSGQNVGQSERAVKAVLGSILVLWGLRRKSVGGGLTAILGVSLVGESISGHSRLYQWFGINHADDSPKSDAASHRTPQGAQSSALQNDESIGAHHATGDVKAFITIGKAPQEVYEAWQNPQIFSQVMGGFAEVTPLGEERLRWTMANGVSHETQSVEAVPGQLVRWEAVLDEQPASDKPKLMGEARFASAPGNSGTEVSLQLHLPSPADHLPIGLAKFLKLVPTGAATKILRNFKALLETGEIPTLANNVSARGTQDKF